MRNRRLERKCSTRPIEAVGMDGTFCGYASLFGVADLGRDAVERGAFAASLARRGIAGIRMLYQHDPAEPIGCWQEIREDHHGLFVRGRLASGVARAEEVLQLLRARALDGLSIGFRTIRSELEPRTRIRRIVEADLWEVSIVTFPMLPGARVGEVKTSHHPLARSALAATIRRAARLFNQEKK